MAMSSKEKQEAQVALLRGINVGGKNIVPMKDLAEIFAAGGCRDVRTYIQSGNVIFRAPAAVLKGLPALVSEKIATQFGHCVPVILRSTRQIAETIRNNPYLKAGEEERMLHVVFLADLPAAAAVRNLDPDRSPPDAFHVHQREIYLHLPNGAARTKLNTAYFDSKLATIGTQRNWATVSKLLELMRS
jgi:uncharacterized protein (DUF1697 family)